MSDRWSLQNLNPTADLAIVGAALTGKVLPAWWLDEAVTELRDAIVKQAVRDYRQARRTLRREPGDQAARALMADVMDYFHSEWFGCMMPEIETDWMLRLLREEDRECGQGAADQDNSGVELMEWETDAADQEDSGAWTRKGA